MKWNKWYSMAPWLLSIISVVILVLLSYFVINNFNWIKESYNISELNILEKRNIILIHSALFKRVIGFFTSLLLIFSGLSISAFFMSKQTEVELKVNNIGISIISVSPGIIAMILGVFLMVVSITSKDSFTFNDGTGISQSSTSLGEQKDLTSKDNSKNE